ncbi:MAG TPA: hypothetical protein VHL09_14915 [Dehalococcoidia bacterium]|nr:hypothetical protein [Dehalococcoidia bacterium]
MAPFIVVVVAAGFLAFTRPGQTAVATVIFLPQAFPQTGPTPIERVTEPPVLQEVQIPTGGGSVSADLYRPASDGPHGALVFYLGIQPVERRDPSVVRLAEGLARLGLVVLVPELPALYSGKLDPAEIEILVAAIEFLRRGEDVNPDKIGMTGFSAGAGLMLLAAEDARVADKVDWVNSFGGYVDAVGLVRDVLAQEIWLPDGTRRTWVPEPLSLAAVRRQLIEALPEPADRAILLNVFFGTTSTNSTDLVGLTQDGQTLYRILTATSPAQVDQLLPTMPAPVVAALHSISPDRGLDQLQAYAFVMHDRDDHYIPFTQSRRLAEAMPPDQVHYTEFALFQHVEPTQDLDPISFTIEIGRLFGHMYGIFSRALH